MSNSKLLSVKKIKDGVYMLNDVLQVSEFNFDDVDESGIFCKMDFNESEITENDANALVDEFIGEALRNIIEK